MRHQTKMRADNGRDANSTTNPTLEHDDTGCFAAPAAAQRQQFKHNVL